MLLVLKSPRFLYREIGRAGRTPYDVASRLSFGLWDSLPDQALLRGRGGRASCKAASRSTAQAERMVADLRTRSKVREFLLQWLKVEHVPDLAKDPQYPGFDAAVASDLRTSLDLFLDDVIWSEASDFRQLLLADELST